jgi:hypothetical protein
MATVLTQVGIQKSVLGIGAGTLTIPKYIGHGTGAGTAGATDTTLFTESADTRATGTVTQVTTTVTNDTHQVVGTLTNGTGSDETITNAGLFDAASTGNMWIKGDFTGQLIHANDQIQYTFKLKQA